MTATDRQSPPYAAIALLSAAALGYEVLLMRLFSIVQWHHFASMIISLALLGYGAAGTFVTLARPVLERRYQRTFVSCAGLFGATSIACLLLAQRIPFNALEILWSPLEPLRLAAVYLLLAIPFFFAATAICLTFGCFGPASHRIYAADIGGAGAGCLAVIAALFVRDPAGALGWAAAAGLAAAGLAARGTGRAAETIAWWIAATVVALAWPGNDGGLLRLSEYKDLTQALRIPGAKIVAQRSSPLGSITVVDNPSVPLRHAPGMSLGSAAEPPPQLGFFVDGDGPSALNRYDGRTEPLAYLDQLTSALPYHLLDRPRVLVLGAGTGSDVLQGLFHHAASVIAVELNPQIIELVESEFAGFSGRPYSQRNVRLHTEEARHFVQRSPPRYDLIQIALLDAFGGSAAGLYALSETYLYTIEAFQAYLRALAPGGLLAVTRWVDLPPRDALKTFATAAAALQAQGVKEPGRRLALIRGWKTATLLVKNGEFADEDIVALREFCRARSFDVAYYPGMAAHEANRYNRLDQAYFFDGAQALLGPARDDFTARYKFDIAPATDDRPFFFHFFRWNTLPEFWQLKNQGGLPLIEWGYPLLVATLAQALVASLLLILLPVVKLGRASTSAAAATRWRVAVYFGCLGFAFMFVEIAFIQKFVLFLSHPVYAASVVLCAFLVFAGMGSRFSQKTSPGHAGIAGWAPFAAIAVLAAGYAGAFPLLFAWLAPAPQAVKFVLSVALVAPLAFVMGMPFPGGLARLAADDAARISWAWAINGCASVVGAVLAALLAIHLGFAAVILIAAALYGLAGIVRPQATPGNAPT